MDQQQQHQPKFATSIPCLVLNNMFMNLCRFNVKNHNSAQSTCQPPPIFRLVVRPKRLQKSTREGRPRGHAMHSGSHVLLERSNSIPSKFVNRKAYMSPHRQPKKNATHILSFTQLKGGPPMKPLEAPPYKLPFEAPLRYPSEGSLKPPLKPLPPSAPLETRLKFPLKVPFEAPLRYASEG